MRVMPAVLIHPPAVTEPDEQIPGEHPVSLPRRERHTCWWPPSWPRNATWVNTIPIAAATIISYQDPPTTANIHHSAANASPVTPIRAA
jgi:hypothetical protein